MWGDGVRTRPDLPPDSVGISLWTGHAHDQLVLACANEFLSGNDGLIRFIDDRFNDEVNGGRLQVWIVHQCRNSCVTPAVCVHAVWSISFAFHVPEHTIVHVPVDPAAVGHGIGFDPEQ